MGMCNNAINPSRYRKSMWASKIEIWWIFFGAHQKPLEVLLFLPQSWKWKMGPSNISFLLFEQFSTSMIMGERVIHLLFRYFVDFDKIQVPLKRPSRTFQCQTNMLPRVKYISLYDYIYSIYSIFSPPKRWKSSKPKKPGCFPSSLYPQKMIFAPAPRLQRKNGRDHKSGSFQGIVGGTLIPTYPENGKSRAVSLAYHVGISG